MVEGKAGENQRIEALFMAQARATPDAPALIHRGRTLSYAQLADWVERLSDDLGGHGVGPGVLTALCMARTPMMIALILAILRARGAYLPMDPRDPPARLSFQLKDSGAGVLIAGQASNAWRDFAGTRLAPSGQELVGRTRGAAPQPVGPADLAYVIYTSGSTGRPKGVMLGHDAVRLVRWAQRTYSAKALSRVAATTSITFDPSVFEIFTPLSSGGAVILKSDALESFDPSELPTMMGVAPAVLRALLAGRGLPPGLEVLNVGGEALSLDLVRAAYSNHPGLTIYNHYGPTETTTCVTVARLERDLAGAPPLGPPVRDATVVLLDEDGRPTPDGEIGEIYIGGPGVALGYLNRPELTAERFVAVDGERRYRTGDLATWRDGAFHFAGRTDRQVKLRGFRVEPGEIEAVLMNDPRIGAAIVRLVDRTGGPQLVAYVEAAPPLDVGQLRRRLGETLPAHMVPSRFVVLPAFPRLVSGKVDHAALPEAFDQAPPASHARTRRAERPILHVFEEILGQRLGPEDSFFDAGGDSLSSLNAAVRLEEVLGCAVPAGLLQQAPSARRLVSALKHAQPQADSHLGLLRPGGAAAALFCLADLFGQPFNYLSLARHLSGDRQVWGVSPGPLQQVFTRDGDLAALTAGYLAEIKGKQPRGPYLLAGYSAGGLLAADLAAALEREGDEVRLILIDSALLSHRPSWSATINRVKRRFLTPSRDKRGQVLTLQGPGRDAAKPAPDWIPKAQAAFATRLIQVGATHRPLSFRGATLLVVAQDRDRLDAWIDDDGLNGWSDVLSGDVRRITVPGRHHDILREPNVLAVAQSITDFISGEQRLCA